MDVKQLMLQYFQRPQINSKILQYINIHNISYQSLTNDDLMSILQQLKILDPLLLQLQQQSNTNSHKNTNLRIEDNKLQDIQISTKTKNLKIWIEKGRNFKSWSNNVQGNKFFIAIALFGQKYRTNTGFLSQNFTIGQQYVLNVNNSQLKIDNSQLLQLAVIIQTKQGTRRIQSIKLIQWRYVLAHGSVTFDVFLAPYYHEGIGDIPSLGIISMKLQLTPLSKLNMVQPTTIDRQIQLQIKNKQKYNNQFYTYANIYWNQYKNIHKTFQSRRIKIYGDSDDKIFIPLCRFVYPLYNIRGIDSPQHALRYCSLIPFQQQKLTKKSYHKRFHSIISGLQGTIDDHCNLLCSLLLGFGLKAYVCIGYSYKGQHSWVLTQDSKNGSIIFWQCTKCTKYDIFSPKIYDIYKSIHTVYNNSQFYTNIQLDDSIAGTKYKFKDNTLWKAIDMTILENIPLYNRSITLNSPTFDIIKIQNNIQQAICQNIEQFRKNNKLSCKFDNILASILSTALANYEIERITGLTFCQNQFQNAIKNYIPARHIFKAFPIQLTTLAPNVIMETLKNQNKCKEILLTNGDNVYFGIRSKLVVYPDNVFVLWLSIGVRYYKII